MGIEDIVKISVDTRVNHGELQKLIQAEVRLFLGAMIKTPIGQLAAGNLAPDDRVLTTIPAKKTAKKTPNANAKTKPAVAKASAPLAELDFAAPTKSDDPMKDLIRILEAKPEGIRAVDLRAQLGWAKGYYVYQMKKPEARKLFSTKGQKAATTYFPNTKAIEKHKANGASELVHAPN